MLNFLAQRRHVAVDGAGGNVATDAPHVPEQLLAADRSAPVLDEVG
jgi:hypothetical protein